MTASYRQHAGRFHTVLRVFVIPSLAALAAAVFVTAANASQCGEPDDAPCNVCHDSAVCLEHQRSSS
jgi:hypothetical protein